MLEKSPPEPLGILEPTTRGGGHPNPQTTDLVQSVFCFESTRGTPAAQGVSPATCGSSVRCANGSGKEVIVQCANKDVLPDRLAGSLSLWLQVDPWRVSKAIFLRSLLENISLLIHSVY